MFLDARLSVSSLESRRLDVDGRRLVEDKLVCLVLSLSVMSDWTREKALYRASEVGVIRPWLSVRLFFLRKDRRVLISDHSGSISS